MRRFAAFGVILYIGSGVRCFCLILEERGVAKGPGLGVFGPGRPEKMDWLPYGFPSRRDACKLPGTGWF